MTANRLRRLHDLPPSTPIIPLLDLEEFGPTIKPGDDLGEFCISVVYDFGCYSEIVVARSESILGCTLLRTPADGWRVRDPRRWW
jgi:hypothetical protein